MFLTGAKRGGIYEVRDTFNEIKKKNEKLCNKKIKNYGLVINDIDSLIIWKSYNARDDNYYLLARLFYDSFYQDFYNLFFINENYIDSIPHRYELSTPLKQKVLKENILAKEEHNNKPNRKDYKSSSNYMKALRKYHKSNKDNK